MINWTNAGPSILASFLASMVEFVEALTIVLAVGTVRGWRPALIGTAAGTAALALLVLIFGPALKYVPLHILQITVGVLLLLFGMRWLRKASLRAAGIIDLHDEDAIYAKEKALLEAEGIDASASIDWVAILATGKAVLLEGLEVVFIVIAVGAAGRMLVPACLGALAAGILVILLGAAIHRPLTKIPENSIKLAVGILLSAFGTFWLGEGLHFSWPGEDLSILGLIAGFFLAASLSSSLARGAALQLKGSKG